MAELDGRRREARSTATRMGDLARARRAAVIAARLMGGTRAVHVRRVTLLLVGETALRRVRAAAAVAAANSGPIDTFTFTFTFICHPGKTPTSGPVETHRGGRKYLLILPGCCRERGNPLPRSPRRLTACVIAGCVGHAPVHSDSDPRAWGSGDHARAALC